MAKTTITEVAARAGVTKSTVSHALSGKRAVAPETRQRIEAAIAELGYRPNALAQRLAAGRSRGLGLALPPGQVGISLFDTPFISAAVRAAARAGHSLALLQPGEGAVGLSDRFTEGLFDGALLLRVAAQDPRIAVARASELPFAMIGRAADNAGLTFVDVDIDAAVDMAVDHLHALGHQRLAFLRPPDLRDGWAARGLAAYELACARRRIRLLTALMPSNTHDARLAALSLLRERNELTGILAWSEWAGWAAMLAAADAGLRVPDDLSIVCLWHGAGSELLPFAPARVDLRAEQLAEAAVALLLQQVDGDEPGEQQVLLQPELIVGESAAPPWRV